MRVKSGALLGGIPTKKIRSLKPKEVSMLYCFSDMHVKLGQEYWTDLRK